MKFFKHILLLLWLFCSWSVSSAQSRIKHDLTLDTIKVNQLIHVASRQNSPDSAIKFANDALAISKNIDYKEGIENSLHILAKNHWKKKETVNSLRNYLVLLNIIEKECDSVKAAKIYTEVGMIYKAENLYEKALEYFLNSKEFLQNYNGDLRSANEENIGLIYYYLKKYKTAREHYLLALDVPLRKKDYLKIISIYQAIVSTYKSENDYRSALDFYFKILEKTKESKDIHNEALTLNNIGYVYGHLSDYENAINYFNKTLEALTIIGNKQKELIDIYTNIGITYQNMGKQEKTLQNLLEAKKLLEKHGSEEEIATIYDLLALIYFNLKDYHNAQFYNQESLRIASKNNFAKVKQACYKTSSIISQELNDYKKALDYYKEHLSIRDSLIVEDRLRQQNLLQQQFVIERTEKELKLLLVGEEIKDLEIKRLLLESDKVDKENELLRKSRENQDLKAKETLQALMLTEQKYEAEKKDKQITLLHQTEELHKLALEQKELQEKERQKEIELLTKDNEIHQLEIEKQNSLRKSLYGLSFLLIIIMILIFIGFIFTRKSKKKVERKNKEISIQKQKLEESKNIIAIEKEKSEQLLLNILPQKIAEELKEKGSAAPQHYKKVSILFTDFIGFTNIAETTSPEILLEDLNYFFHKFDEITESHGLEKIKTVGDAYMCAGGIPEANDTNPYDTVSAGLEICAFMRETNKERVKKGLSPWGIRIGIHTGPTVAGVIGKKKFVYDIWGDAVNIASRIESNGTDGKINISGTTYNLIKDQFNCTYRGELEAKNKGKIAMYFVEGKRY